MSPMMGAQGGQADEFDPFSDPSVSGVIERVVASTEAQREVWLACQMSPQATLAYNEAVKITLTGNLDLNQLELALNLLVMRHESLRATFSDDGLQFVVNGQSTVELQTHDLRGKTAGEIDSAIAAIETAAVSTRFDLERGPLLRVQLAMVGALSYELILSAHHIVCDGWSFGVIANELAELYSKRALAQCNQYSDYSASEAELITSAEFSQDQTWWIKQFDQSQPVLELPLDRARPAQRGFESGRVDRLIEPPLANSVKSFAQQQGANPFAVLLLAFASTLQRFTDQNDLVIGVPAAGQASHGMPKLVGHCVNLLPLRLQVDSLASVQENFSRVQSYLLDAFDHQRYTFGTLIKSLQLGRDPARLPLVSVMFNLDQALDQNAMQFDGLSARLQSIARTHENFELFLNIVPQGQGYKLECQYNSQLFDLATIENWLQSYEALLNSLVNHPNAALNSLQALSAKQLGLLKEWNATELALPADQTLESLLARSASLYPDEVAVMAARARLTHSELRARVLQLANFIRSKLANAGEQPDSVTKPILIGISLARNADMVIAVLAVIEAGAAFVPLDPSFPAERLDYMIKDAGLALVICDSAIIQQLPWDAEQSILMDRDAGLIDSFEAKPCALIVDQNLPSYILYTSGSTGKPKGVALTRAALSNLLMSMAEQQTILRKERLLAVTTLSFDISLMEVLLPIYVGAALVVATREQVLDGHALMQLIEQYDINVMQATPSGWRILFEAGWQGRLGFKAVVGGEPLATDLAFKLACACAHAWNRYGPTETTIYSTSAKLSLPLGPITIGRPIANTQIYLLDKHLQGAPIGARAEICIGGIGVALGYLNREDLTQEKFVIPASGPAAGQRIYRTGDWGRWRADGQLEHLGRLDAQVKLRGFRIELGEIETALMQQANVLDSVAIIREDMPGDLKLVAYVSAQAGQSVSGQFLREQLKKLLPDYMVPQAVVVMAALPRLPNTKVNRAALLPPDLSGSANLQNVASDSVSRSVQKPQGPLQQLVAQAMNKVLGLVDVGAHQDFFSLGGHSLTAAQLAARINRLLQEQGTPNGKPARVSVKAIFQNPTVAGIAQFIEHQSQDEFDDQDQIVRRTQRTDAPLSLVQERMWFLEKLNPGRSLYNTPSAHRLRGPLDIALLQSAFDYVVDRQDVLRTVVAVQGESAVQRVLDSVKVDLSDVEDLSLINSADRNDELMCRLDILIETPISMLQGPMFLVKLFKLAAQEHVLFFMPHQFIWDGWSFDLFYDEMSAAYFAGLEGKKPDLAPLPVS